MKTLLVVLLMLPILAFAGESRERRIEDTWKYQTKKECVEKARQCFLEDGYEFVRISPGQHTFNLASESEKGCHVECVRYIKEEKP